VLLSAGDEVCADGVIFERNDVGISEASLTGESVIKKKVFFFLTFTYISINAYICTYINMYMYAYVYTSICIYRHTTHRPLSHGRVREQAV